MRPVTRRIFIIAGEHSGDVLGGKLMAALKGRTSSILVFSGIGGEHMAAEGLKSLFPLADIAVMGPAAILGNLPRLAARVAEATRAGLAAEPDCLVIIDSPEFTHRVARRMRRRRPDLPVVDYVSPTVWAWRPGRARRMAAYVDHVLALLPFEPDAHARLGGPVCSYVGHPLIERRAWIEGIDVAGLARRLKLQPGRPVLAVLPGSRSTEVRRLMAPFGETVARLMADRGPVEVILPVVPSVRGLVEEALTAWPVRPHLVEGEADKFAAFRLADAALAASGTVTLELGVTGVPMVVAYRVDPLAALLRFLVRVHSVVLANLVLGRNAFPELLQEDCTPDKLAGALRPLLADTPDRRAQLAALAEIGDRMRLPHGTPSDRAAEIVLGVMLAPRRRVGAA